MRTSIGLTGMLTALAAGASPMYAQLPSSRASLDSVQVVGVISGGLRLLSPAQFVLDHRAELGLTTEQVTRLEVIAAAQRDSATVRRQRMMDEFVSGAVGRTPRPSAMGWSGPLDEEAIREELRRVLGGQEERMIILTRDRHVVGAVLSPTQLAMLPHLQAETVTRGMTSPATPPSGPENHAYLEYQVERQVVTLPGQVPSYPSALRAAKVEGEVLAQFVVDITGRYESGSLKVLASSHALFTEAVRDALPQMRFSPAELGGRKVRQLVQQPFTFALGPN